MELLFIAAFIIPIPFDMLMRPIKYVEEGGLAVEFLDKLT